MTTKISTTDKSVSKPSLIMTPFSPILLSKNNWEWLSFDFSSLDARFSSTNPDILPCGETIEELFFPWLGNPPPEYHLEKYINLKKVSSKESNLMCREYSNHAVQSILLHYRDPSYELISHGKFLRKFCERNSKIYEIYEYWLLVMRYFEIIYPVGANADTFTPMCIHIGSQLDSVVSGNKLQKTGNDKRDKEIDSISKLDDKIREHRQNILSTRFALYKTAYEGTRVFMSRFWQSDEGREAFDLIVGKGEVARKLITKYENYTKRSNKDERITIEDTCYKFKLQQCLFCGEFYEIHKNKANNPSRYCGDPDCKKRNAAWVQKLKRKGESPESLGLSIKTSGDL